MPQRSPVKVQGSPSQRGATAQTPRLGGARHLPKGAGLWAWLVLTALLAPGAWSFLSEEQEELLVELHNHYRGLVSPSASAMMPLKWDPILKVVAEEYASKCIWNHNADLEDTGENLYVTQGPLDLREALEKWFLEHLDYVFNNNSCDEDKMCGHYTQMVWADTHRIGCAFHLCNIMVGLEWERASFLVCNYYPAGNYEDERPYVEGDWCSRCPEDLQKCENNLCVADTVDEEDLDEGTVIPPPATPQPSPLPAEDAEENALPPTSSAPSYVQPAATVFTHTHTQPPDTPPPDTPQSDTPPPDTPTSGITVTPQDIRDPEKNMEEEEGRGKNRVTTEMTAQREIKVNKFPRKNLQSCGWRWFPPLLLVCLMAFFILNF
ncbi:peptidase inhibitor 16-like [Takifugu rubripes]|uniref:Peptidase inhibitor 16-like n=1 Tax=Takifugu rubripes TaxID=31033 RepID=A0A674NPT5_TAKRU|nr:peptidase inhibitor 16-like [Takifugu rubripes]